MLIASPRSHQKTSPLIQIPRCRLLRSALNKSTSVSLPLSLPVNFVFCSQSIRPRRSLWKSGQYEQHFESPFDRNSDVASTAPAGPSCPGHPPYDGWVSTGVCLSIILVVLSIELAAYSSASLLLPMPTIYQLRCIVAPSQVNGAVRDQLLLLQPLRRHSRLPTMKQKPSFWLPSGGHSTRLGSTPSTHAQVLYLLR